MKALNPRLSESEGLRGRHIKSMDVGIALSSDESLATLALSDDDVEIVDVLPAVPPPPAGSREDASPGGATGDANGQYRGPVLRSKAESSEFRSALLLEALEAFRSLFQLAALLGSPPPIRSGGLFWGLVVFIIYVHAYTVPIYRAYRVNRVYRLYCDYRLSCPQCISLLPCLSCLPCQSSLWVVVSIGFAVYRVHCVPCLSFLSCLLYLLSLVSTVTGSIVVIVASWQSCLT
ncbi:unnamed protein product [Phytophthora fragariaefolia]|uniref:Unnamed protein product n=1 Tax=Phytophthora fragariaefolia TaxID=1490495 RepID=A0A9W7CRA5_9STRA|nr:unnamed protein product [Phytophthora fragariaefolia]